MKRNILIGVAVVLAVAAIGYFMLWLSYGRQDPNHYIGNSPDECSRIRFICEPGKTEYFANDKGCGCKPVAQ